MKKEQNLPQMEVIEEGSCDGDRCSSRTETINKMSVSYLIG